MFKGEGDQITAFIAGRIDGALLPGSICLSDQRLLDLPGPVASPKNVTEVQSRLIDPNRSDLAHDSDAWFAIAGSVYDSINEFTGHYRSPLLEPPLLGAQLLWADTFGMIAHQYSQDLCCAGVGMILQVGEHLGPDVLQGIFVSSPPAALSFGTARWTGIALPPQMRELGQELRQVILLHLAAFFGGLPMWPGPTGPL